MIVPSPLIERTNLDDQPVTSGDFRFAQLAFFATGAMRLNALKVLQHQVCLFLFNSQFWNEALQQWNKIILVVHLELKPVFLIFLWKSFYSHDTTGPDITANVLNYFLVGVADRKVGLIFATTPFHSTKLEASFSVSKACEIVIVHGLHPLDFIVGGFITDVKFDWVE